MKYITLGILAHVDAGKTTLCEQLLYKNQVISRFGRVDKQESFLDYDELERKRGITIFSKEAIINIPEKDTEITLLDTPGHVDFVWETLACMEVMDAALLVVDASSSLSIHTKRLFRLLKKNKIPTFVFMNKTDISGENKSELLEELSSLDSSFVDFTLEQKQLCEMAAMCDEELLDEFLEADTLKTESIKAAIKENKITPVFFGSALNDKGIDELNNGLLDYISAKKISDKEFVAFKRGRDEKGNKIVFGRIQKDIRVKETLCGEKIEEIRRYHGQKYESVASGESGMLVAIRGLDNLEFKISGDGAYLPLLEYEIVLPDEIDTIVAVKCLEFLCEEHPALNLRVDTKKDRLLFSPMGDIQMEILKDIIEGRAGLKVEFIPAGVVYKETVAWAVEGMGHFEPLRHYAEAHILIEPNPGRGIEVNNVLGADALSANWQNQILSTLKSTHHRGVLTGAELTDVRLTLVAGRAHEKHTEGGDFREATIRAVRQGLMVAGCILLEPMYSFELRLPAESVGKVISRLEIMAAKWEPAEYFLEEALIKGVFKVQKLGDFPSFLSSVASGNYELSLGFGGYTPCEEGQSIIESSGYDPEADLEAPCDSVFTHHGSSEIIHWSEAPLHMHIPPVFEDNEVTEDIIVEAAGNVGDEIFLGTEEIDRIVGAAGGANKKSNPKARRSHWNRYSKIQPEGRDFSDEKDKMYRRKPLAFKGDEYLLVDGYNIIFAWDELNALSKDNIDAAKDSLVDTLSEYAAYTGKIVILVFDAYRVSGGVGSISRFKGIDIVYTKEAQTADAYIEKTSHELSKEHFVRVATSDRLEQMIVRGDGALPMSALDLKDEIFRIKTIIRENISK